MEIARLLPQKPPMVLVDALLKCDESGATTQLLIRDDNIFVENERLSAAGLVENIAQTAAAQAGYLSAAVGQAPPVGYIAAIDHLEIYALPALHSTLTTTIEVINQVLNVTIIRGKITCQDQPVAQCEMKIFIRVEKGGDEETG